MKAKATVCLQNTARLFRKACRVSAALLSMIVLCFSLAATADPKGFDAHQLPKGSKQSHETQQPRTFQQKSSGISPQQAVSIAKQRQPGKVLSVKRNNGYYKVKMLHEGKVRYVKVDSN